MDVSNLKAYLANIGMKCKDFSEIAECSQCFLSAVMHGKKFVSKEFQRKVYNLTDGEVLLPMRPFRKKKSRAKKR